MKVLGHIEIPMGMSAKFEFNKKIKAFVLDRFVDKPYPYAYGYALNTMSQDGDPTDLFVLSTMQLLQGLYINLTVIGTFRCVDNGVEDDKLVCIIPGDNYAVTDQDIFKIDAFLSSYKTGFKVKSYEESSDKS